MGEITQDLEKFGNIELKIASELLSALAEINTKSNFFGEGLTLNFNTGSGYVFLSDEDFNVGVMEEGKLVQFFTCSECGWEGTKSEYDSDKKNGDTKKCCKEMMEKK